MADEGVGEVKGDSDRTELPAAVDIRQDSEFLEIFYLLFVSEEMINQADLLDRRFSFWRTVGSFGLNWLVLDKEKSDKSADDFIESARLNAKDAGVALANIGDRIDRKLVSLATLPRARDDINAAYRALARVKQAIGGRGGAASGSSRPK